jgi:hypothetical protein
VLADDISPASNAHSIGSSDTLSTSKCLMFQVLILDFRP